MRGNDTMTWNWRQLAAICTVAAAIGGIATPIIRSDAAPWASVARVEGVRSEVIATDIGIVWASYCEAERMSNKYARRAAASHIETLEQDYAALNEGREVALLPCP